jgi:hypothetical protein
MYVWRFGPRRLSWLGGEGVCVRECSVSKLKESRR